jgi:hypothetical protein
VPPEAFLAVMMPAAAAGRMDVVRTMMGAVDQHLALQVSFISISAAAACYTGSLPSWRCRARWSQCGVADLWGGKPVVLFAQQMCS